MTIKNSQSFISRPYSLRRTGYLTLASLSLTAALAGLVLPLLPATPFLLLAGWASAKGSPRMHRWIWTQPQLLRILLAWREQGAVPTGAKWLASAMSLSSWLVLFLISAHWPILLAAAILFAGIAGFLWSRPAPVNLTLPISDPLR